jgi:hypothetical protein
MDGSTLYIDSWSSECSACGHGADPDEDAHITRLGYGDHNGQGCGAVFVAVSSHYGDYMKDRVMEMRPDLPWEG